MIDPITKYMLEGYIFTNKTISVNLSDFESRKNNKLIIVGVMGSGKSTIGKNLAKKYKVKWISIDSFWWRLKQKYFKDVEMNAKEMKNKLQDKFEDLVIKYLKSNERMIIEGINLLEPKYRKLVLKHSMIILGISSLKSGIRAAKRNRERENEGWKTYYWLIKLNMKKIEPYLKTLRKDAINISNVKIEEYKVPKIRGII